jgi:hypothetical protein
MAQAEQPAVAELLAQARIALDTALRRTQGGESLGDLSEATLARLAEAQTNTGCNNTSCRPKLT